MNEHGLFLICALLILLGRSQTSLAQPAKNFSVPKRAEISEQYKWKLQDIYAKDADWETDFAAIKNAIPQLKKFQGTLASSAQTVLECLTLRDKTAQSFGKLFVYARMHQDEETANTAYQALTDRASRLSAELDSAVAYIDPELLSLSAEKLKDLPNQKDGLAVYAHYFDELLRMQSHVLSPAEEAILAQAGEILRAPDTIRGMLSNADMKFPKIRDEEGRDIELSEGRYYKLITSADRRVRKDAFSGLLGTYEQFANTYGAALNSSVKKDVFYAGVKNYPSALHAALYPDNIPVEVYDNVITTVNRSLAPLQRYIALKKKVLGYEKLHMYDLYVPLSTGKETLINYEEAQLLVLEALRPLGGEYGQLLKDGLAAGWIDVYENQGKRKGAYAWGAYGTHPYVLLNYNHTLRDVLTLAHEMGHAIHTHYSHKHQPYPYADYTIFCAEVASTTNESLLIRHLLQKTTDKQQKVYLLDQYLEQFRGTVFRQTMFAEFEKDIHMKVEAGEALTPALLSEMWHTLNIKYYGDHVVVDPEIDIEWARIGHFYWNFYVYKYVTGYAAGTAFAQKILHEGERAREKYLGFLKSGSSDYSLNILKKAGVDLTTPEPLEASLHLFEEMLRELEVLV